MDYSLPFMRPPTRRANLAAHPPDLRSGPCCEVCRLLAIILCWMPLSCQLWMGLSKGQLSLLTPVSLARPCEMRNTLASPTRSPCNSAILNAKIGITPMPACAGCPKFYVWRKDCLPQTQWVVKFNDSPAPACCCRTETSSA